AGQVLGAVPAPHRTGIFAEEHIEHPVEAILDVPVLADRLPQDRRLGRQTGEVIARVDGPLGARPPLRLDLDNRAQARPGAARVQTRQQVRIAQRVVAAALQAPMPLVEGLGAVASCPSTSPLAVAQALTRCSASRPRRRSAERRSVLPSTAITWPAASPSTAWTQAMKHCWNSAGSSRANTRPKVSCDGMPPG